MMQRECHSNRYLQVVPLGHRHGHKIMNLHLLNMIWAGDAILDDSVSVLYNDYYFSNFFFLLFFILASHVHTTNSMITTLASEM